ncbi:MAG TPA: ABC transporter permease, partial [Geobacteraceae bacterium]
AVSATVMFVFSAVVGGVLMFKAGMEAPLARAQGRLGADLMVVPQGVDVPLMNGLVGGVPTTFSLPSHLEEKVAAVEGVAAVAPQYFLASARASCCEQGNLFLVGFDPARDFTVRPWAKEILRRDQDDSELLVGGGVMKAPGATFFFYGKVFTVATRLDRTGMGFFDNSAFMTLGGVAAMERSSRQPGRVSLNVPWGRPSAIFIKVSPGAQPQQVAARIGAISPDAAVVATPEIFRKGRERLATLAGALFPLALGSWLVAATMVFALQILFWRERREAAGLLQALGMSRLGIATAFGAEAAVMASGSALAGILAAAGLLRVFSPYITVVSGYPFLLTPATCGAPLLLALFAAVVATCVVPAVLAVGALLRHEPYELLRRNG